MSKTVVLVAALDTKGADLAFIKGLVEDVGHQTLVVDIGVLGDPILEPDLPRSMVIAAGGGDLARMLSGEHKDEAMQVMASGLTRIVRHLWDEGRLDGILGLGGGSGTSIITTAMRALPVGLPKVMVSTLAGGDVSMYAGTSDIVFMPSVVDIAGVNRISRTIYANAAGAIAGMVELDAPPAESDKPLIAASMFGNTTPCVERASLLLEETGFEVLVFHATGMGGRTMEGLIDDCFFAGVLDITLTELADYVCGGVMDAGPERALAAARAGLPAVLVPGCVDMANFWNLDTVPERYRDRTLYQWNPDVMLLRTDMEENRRIGELIAAAANESSGPVAILLPLGGVSMLDKPGSEFWDPAADRACFDAIKAQLRDGIPVFESEHNINDPEFADLAARTLLDMM